MKLKKPPIGTVSLSAARWLLLSRIEIEESFFYVSGIFELAGKILYGILLLLTDNNDEDVTHDGYTITIRPVFDYLQK